MLTFTRDPMPLNDVGDPRKPFDASRPSRNRRHGLTSAT